MGARASAMVAVPAGLVRALDAPTGVATFTGVRPRSHTALIDVSPPRHIAVISGKLGADASALPPLTGKKCYGLRRHRRPREVFATRRKPASLCRSVERSAITTFYGPRTRPTQNAGRAEWIDVVTTEKEFCAHMAVEPGLGGMVRAHQALRFTLVVVKDDLRKLVLAKNPGKYNTSTFSRCRTASGEERFLQIRRSSYLSPQAG